MQVLAASRANNKENHSAEPTKELQKLRIQLNDRNFELHKLEEDHAQEKARIFIQLQKEKQSHAKTIKELRDKIKEDNEGWVRMIDQLRREKEEAMGALRQQLQQHSRNEITHILKETHENHNKIVEELKNQIKEREQIHQKNEEKWKISSERDAAQALQNFRKELEERDRKQKLILTQLKKEFQENINKLQGVYFKEEFHRQQVELELQNTIKSHVKEKIGWERSQNDFNQQVKALQNTVNNLQAQIEQLKRELEEMQASHKTQIQSIKNENLSKLQQLVKENCEKQRQKSCFYSAQIESLKVEIDKLLEIHRKKEESWLESGKMVLELLQKRESKKEDVKAIQKLEVQLIKKDFLIQRERKELKNCKLELENMEQIYDRIFIYNSNLNRSKVKSYQIKKLKTSSQLNQSNRSTILSDKNIERRYPCERND